MLKKKLLGFVFIIMISICIYGCDDKEEDITKITTDYTMQESTADIPGYTKEPLTEEQTDKTDEDTKEESLVWDGTTVYINNEEGMKLFKDDSKRASVEKVVLKDGITYIDSRLFWECKSLSDVVIPDSVILIKFMAFFNCQSLKEINLPNTLLSIEAGAFYACTNLKEISLPKNIGIIPTWCFYGCDNLLYVECKGNISEICSQAFVDGSSIYGNTYLMLSTDSSSDGGSGTGIANDAFSRSYVYIYHKPSPIVYDINSMKAKIYEEVYSYNICTEIGHIWGDPDGCRMEYPCILCDELSEEISSHDFNIDGVCTVCGLDMNTGDYINLNCLEGKHEWVDAESGEISYCEHCKENAIDMSFANYKIFYDSDGNKVIKVKDLYSYIITKDKIIEKADGSYDYNNQYVPGYTQTDIISELMNGHEPTNKNTKFSVSELEASDESISYDTKLIEREIGGKIYYVGKLFGKYIYNISSEYKEMFDIDIQHIVASNGRYIQLGYDREKQTPISLYNGEIVYREEP